MAQAKLPSPATKPTKPRIEPVNLLVGAGVSLLEITTLGQPLEVLKTQMAANRKDGFKDALRHIWSRGGIKGYYQGLIPWAWIESGTSGAILLFTAAELETFSSQNLGLSRGTAGLIGGCGGGIAQAYLSMGVCTTMKTAEITRLKQAAAGMKPPGTMTLFMDILRNEGIRGVNKGVNAVAIRQCTNWGSRMGFARLTEDLIRSFKGKAKGSPLAGDEKILSSVVGGALGCWNHPIEVIRVEMQSMAANKSANRPAKLTIANTFAFIYKENGIKGLFKGVGPRMALSVWRTVMFVSVADYFKVLIKQQKK